MTAAAALQAFITYLHHQREFADYMYMSATALVVYDYLLNIGREIKMIWFSSWTYTKVLYFIVRYLPFLAFFLLSSDTADAGSYEGVV